MPFNNKMLSEINAKVRILEETLEKKLADLKHGASVSKSTEFGKAPADINELQSKFKEIYERIDKLEAKVRIF